MNPFLLPNKIVGILLLAIGCIASVVVPAANANLILNGSFENPSRNPGGWSIVPTDWTTPSGSGAIIHPPGSLGPLYPPAQHGLQYELLNGGSIVQTSITVATAGDYQLTWFDNTLTDRTTDYQVYMYDSLNQPIASAIVGFFHGATTWNARSLSMTLVGGSYKLQFIRGINYSDGHDYYALDNVSLDAVPVPEPTTMIAGGLLLLPFGASALRMLRRSREA